MMIETEPISNIMTTHVIEIESTCSLYDAQELFRKYKIRHLPVVKDTALVGILSLTDLQRISFATLEGNGEMTSDSELMELLTITHIMQKNPITITEQQSIAEVAKIFVKEEFHALPVMQLGKLVGIVTTTDLIRFMLRNGK